MTITPTQTLQVGHLINDEMTTGDNFRDHRDPGRLSEVVAPLAVGTPADADLAVEAAHQAYLSWRTGAPAERAASCSRPRKRFRAPWRSSCR